MESDLTCKINTQKSRRKDRFKKEEQKNNYDSGASFNEASSNFEIDFDQSHKTEYVAEELEELFQRETISREEFQNLKTKNVSTANRAGLSVSQRQLKHDNKDKHTVTPFPFDGNGVPVNWTSNLELGASPLYNVVLLNPGEIEYDCIHDEMTDAGLKVTKIERLENLYLLNRFKSETEDIKKHRHEGFDVSIRYLYHGTKVDKSRICEEGLDQRLSRMGFFGKGIYFSDNPLKCVHYAKDQRNLEESYILKCRVILGESKRYSKGEYDSSLQREPEKPNAGAGWRFYDSVVGCPKDYNEFVVYENRRAMIEYIISFQLDHKGEEELRRNTSSTFITSTVNLDPSSQDSHIDKIQEIRETIRRKRCLERGEEYTPPDQEKTRKDREMWSRLQQLHKGPQSSAEGSADSKEEVTSDISNTNNADSENSVIDPVEEVLDSLVTDFLAVTATDNIEAAKYYIERSEMDVDRAITMYFEEML